MHLVQSSANITRDPKQKEKSKKDGLNKKRHWDTSKKEHHNMSLPSSSLARRTVVRNRSLLTTEE
jgi:hypothetical protein